MEVKRQRFIAVFGIRPQMTARLLQIKMMSNRANECPL
jgi:hypothetical protein